MGLMHNVAQHSLVSIYQIETPFTIKLISDSYKESNIEKFTQLCRGMPRRWNCTIKICCAQAEQMVITSSRFLKCLCIENFGIYFFASSNASLCCGHHTEN